MLFKRFPELKKKLYTVLLFLLTALYCTPAFTFSIEHSCLNQNKQFISRYFSGQIRPENIREIGNFFDCIDNTIQLFLNHTRTRNPNYYTQTELRRAMQYMGVRKARAETISKAILNLKTGFIGGSTDRLTLSEIVLCRQILAIFKQKMRAAHSSIPTVLDTLNKKNTQRQKLIEATETIKTNLIDIGQQLSRKTFSSNLSLLDKLPQNIQALGFSNTNLKYWVPSLQLLKQWKNIFLNSPEHIIRSNEWPFLLDSFSQLTALWLYHKRFLAGRSWMDFYVVWHVQYFLSHSLRLVQNAQTKYGGKDISLEDIDTLARKVWFLPYVSTPVFRLGLRSTFCFLLNPITNNSTCTHNMDFQKKNIKISFSDITFTITEEKEIYESKSGNQSDQIKKSHLDILRSYMNSWINTENQMKKASRLPPIFGSPNKWLQRRMDITPDRRLLFYQNRKDDKPFLSHLNWQSHLMRLVTAAYTQRGSGEVNHDLWKIMIREWTALSISLYKDMQWKTFQDLGFQVFKHGDFLTSHSNGDNLLQEEEILELFSLFTSSLSTVISSLELMQNCKSTQPYHLTASCVWNHLQQLPQKVFTGFPRLLNTLSRNEDKKAGYISKLQSSYSTQERLSLKDLFEIFLFIHYQENTLEYLDRDSSEDLNVRELEPLLNTFEDTIIDAVPLIYTKRDAYAFITYLFHFGEVPIFTDHNRISAPLRFNSWLLKPEEWSQLKADQEDILHTLFLMNKSLN